MNNEENVFQPYPDKSMFINISSGCESITNALKQDWRNYHSDIPPFSNLLCPQNHDDGQKGNTIMSINENEPLCLLRQS